VTGLAVHPNNDDIVMVSYSNYGNQNIFLTSNATDASPNWTLVERNLATFSIRSALIIEKDGETLYLAGTARGLYSSPDPTSTNWTLEAGSDIGLALISDLEYRSSDVHFLIGTHGNGMYEGIAEQTLSTSGVQTNSVALYPNPTRKWLNIEGRDQGTVDYSIYDLNGKIITSGNTVNNRIDVSTLAQGMYFLSLGKKDSAKPIKFIRN
jgi:hypothetical protein